MSEHKPSDADRARTQAMWQMGDYDGLTRVFRTTTDDFVAKLGAEPPGRALDIACGTGATALPLARRGFEVTGLDISLSLLDVARNEARGQGLSIRFDEGEMEALPYLDASFDLVVSTFGIMFSPTPHVVVGEVARVLKPGGRLAVASWTRGSFSRRMGSAFASHMPPKPASAASPPPDWGNADQAREMLEPDFHRIETRVMPLVWTVDMSAAQAADLFLEKGGPPQFMMRAMTADQRGRAVSGFRRFWIENSTSDDAGRTTVDNEFLLVSGIRKGGAGA